MSGKRDDDAGAVAGMMAGAFLIVLGLLFGLLVLGAIIVSLLYLVSLVTGREFTIWRDTYTPRAALIAYRNGIFGIAVVLGFTAFICAFYQLTFPKDWLLYLVAGGYSVGSLWLWFFYDNGDDDRDTLSTPIDYRALQPPASTPAEKPFEYASWDDERNAP
jgi:hypothetical protein